tara:strand:- start:37307 stop:37534 length:228 start_codon:yes stop_codon:yes gene_type:complete
VNHGPVVSAIQLTPTHDGEAACAVELTFPGGGRSMVQLDSAGLARVMARAGVHKLSGLVGLAWTVLLSARDPAQE